MVGEALYPGLATKFPYCTFVQIEGRAKKKTDPLYYPLGVIRKRTPSGLKNEEKLPFFANIGPQQDSSLATRVQAGWIPALYCPCGAPCSEL